MNEILLLPKEISTKSIKKKKKKTLSRDIYEALKMLSYSLGWIVSLTGYLIYLVSIIAGFYVGKPLRFNNRVSFHWLSKQHYVNTQ